MRSITCVWPCACIEPPITPKLMSGCPLRVTKPGMIVWNGRLRGATTLAWSGRTLNPEPRFWRLMPVPGTTTPEPNPEKFDWMYDTIIPDSSAAVR